MTTRRAFPGRGRFLPFPGAARRRLPLGVLLGALLFPGCSGASPDDRGEDALVLSSDPGLRALAERLIPELAERSGLPLLAPVRVERKSREELLVHVRERLDRDLPPGLARRTTRAYALLGLVPDTLDLRALLMDVYEEQVAGFYDPAVQTLFVLDDQPAEALEPLLLHELVHAIQDQHVSLDSLTAPERGNDRRLAARAAIEGHATLVMLAWMAERREGEPVAPEEMPGLAGMLRPDAGTLAAEYPALSGAPSVLRETLLFPYVSGASFVQSVWRAHPGRPDPLGALLPHSTEQILEAGQGGEGDAPVEVEVRPPPGTVVLEENTLGALESGILLETLGVPGPPGAAGWGGDRWALLEGAGGEVGLLWVSVWDSPADRDRYGEALRSVLESLPTTAVLESGEIDGRPGLVLQVGDVPGVGGMHP